MNAAIYLRSACAVEEYDFHLAELETRVHAAGDTLICVYRDVGISGRTTKRPELTRLLRDAQAGMFSILYIQTYDRLSRHLPTLLEMLKTLRGYGVTVRPADPIEHTALAIYAKVLKHKRVHKNLKPLSR